MPRGMVCSRPRKRYAGKEKAVRDSCAGLLDKIEPRETLMSQYDRIAKQDLPLSPLVTSVFMIHKSDAASFQDQA